VLPAVASGFVPGLGQLLNGESDKAIGVFVVSAVAGLGIWSAIPLIGPLAGLVAGGTWVYGVADGYVSGKRKRAR
jgi:TM2 domain-containing membrane protein YozV